MKLETKWKSMILWCVKFSDNGSANGWKKAGITEAIEGGYSKLQPWDPFESNDTLMSKENPLILCTDWLMQIIFVKSKESRKKNPIRRMHGNILILTLTILTYLMTGNSPILSFYVVLALSFCLFLVKKCWCVYFISLSFVFSFLKVSNWKNFICFPLLLKS